VFSYGDGCLEAGEIFFLVAGSGVGHKVGGAGGDGSWTTLQCALAFIAPWK
jgi:hypothetical protein